MYLTGFADDAADGMDGQIRATQELGWTHIESRAVNKKNLVDVSEADFNEVCRNVERAGIQINCFGSAIANWSKQITDPFDITLEEIARAIPRMKRLGAKLIRIMSYAVLKNGDCDADDQMEQERFRRLREILKRFMGEGLLPVHENCMNYGGMGWSYTQKMLENVPGLKLIFDTGNPVFTDDRTKSRPYPKQSSWEFYTHVKDRIAYVHIKDGFWDQGENKAVYTFPGEGQAAVERIVKDLLDNGYDGGFSMEPHLAVVFHDADVKSDDAVRYANYVEYGRRFMKLLKKIGH